MTNQPPRLDEFESLDEALQGKIRYFQKKLETDEVSSR